MQEYENVNLQDDQIGDQFNQNNPIQPGFETGGAPYVQEREPEQVVAAGTDKKRRARRARKETPVVTPLIAEKLAKRMMDLPPKTSRSDKRKQTADDIVNMLIEPIKSMLERGYNVADIHRFFEQNGIPIAPATIRSSMAKAGIIKARGRKPGNNKGGAE